MTIPVATVVTQVIVDKDDQAFVNPTKPIGAFYTKEEADKLIEEKGFEMVEDSGRGWRRVVPSPIPVDVAEKETVKTLVNNGHVVITVGGGGIPVIREGRAFQGVDAVIDKDLASAKLAEEVGVDIFLIATDGQGAALRYGRPDEKFLRK